MRTEISHFWFGNFKSERVYSNFLAESRIYYEDNDTNENDKYISEFAKSQNENFLDHDFMESGFENQDVLFEDKFVDYSYADQWILEAKKRLVQQNQNLTAINTIVFISKDQIEKPILITNSEFELFYIGEIEYEFD